MAQKRILIVEDEVIVAMDIQRELKRLGYNGVGIANNGKDALSKIEELRPDLILMDIQIQGELDGVETAKLVWSHFRLPVVFLTAHADRATLGRAKAADAFGYVLKPFEERELHTAIEVALSKFRSVENEHKGQQNALRASEEQFKLLVEEVKEYAIYMLDPTGTIISWNAGAERIKGYRADEVIGKYFSIFYTKEDIQNDQPNQELRMASAEGTYKEERWSVRKDGSLFWANIVVTALRDSCGNLRGFGKVTQDLTEKKLAQDELSRMLANETAAKKSLKIQYEVMSLLAESKTISEANQKLLQIMAENLSWDLGVFWVIDEKSQTLQAADIWHLPKINTPKFVQMTQTWRCPLGVGLPGYVWKEKKQAWIKDIMLDLNLPRYVFASQAGLRAAFAFPILSGKNVLGVIEFFSHEIREPDEELFHAVATLGGQIGQFMDRISAEESLRKAVRTRDEFISIASHELKTPITSMKLQVQNLERSLHRGGLENLGEDRLSKALHLSTKQINRLSRLVEDMLEVSRIDSGKLKIEKEECDLGRLVRDVVERSKDQLASARISPILTIENEVIGFWDSFRIEQIISNLLSNAVKYAAENPIEVQVWKEGNAAFVSIKDYGIGIDKSSQERIFNRFERAISISNVAGLGLGLYIVKNIINAHGGRIRVESEIGHGAKFIVELPLKRSQDDRNEVDPKEASR